MDEIEPAPYVRRRNVGQRKRPWFRRRAQLWQVLAPWAISLGAIVLGLSQVNYLSTQRARDSRDTDRRTREQVIANRQLLDTLSTALAVVCDDAQQDRDAIRAFVATLLDPADNPPATSQSAEARTRAIAVLDSTLPATRECTLPELLNDPEVSP